MFTMNPPFGEVHDHELHFVYRLTDANFDVDGEVSRTIGQVKECLQSLQDSAEQLKSDIQHLVNAMIAKRKQERGTHSQIVAGLKIPIRQAPPPAAASSVTSSAPTKKQEEEWDVFISHASEDKEAIATPLAEALQANGLRVWYGDFSLRLGDSLRQSIDRGLARSRFGVVILSARFFEKHCSCRSKSLICFSCSAIFFWASASSFSFSWTCFSSSAMRSLLFLNFSRSRSNSRRRNLSEDRGRLEPWSFAATRRAVPAIIQHKLTHCTEFVQPRTGSTDTPGANTTITSGHECYFPFELCHHVPPVFRNTLLF